jgi:glycosyltransferase involved in cell wall biosynthesis
MFGWEYPPAHLGGLGVACQGIVRGLLHHGATVTLVLPHGAAEESGVNIISPMTTVESGARAIMVPSALQPYDGFHSYETRLQDIGLRDDGIRQLYGHNLGEEVQRFTDMAVSMTRDVQPDIVHTHDWMTLEAGVRAAKFHRKPLVAHVHATELDRTEFNPNPWIFKREILGLRKADHVIAVSAYTRGLLMREYGISGDKITVLHNGTFHAEPQKRPIEKRLGHPLVLFLGRLTVQKGVTHFIDAARKVADQNPGVRFVVAGEGYLLPQLIAQACRVGLQDSIIFAGRVTSAEAKKLYAKADCFVMPSVSEPFGLVALEAITHGAPVVLSKQSGAAEVVHNAMQVDFWDTDKMADCILTVLREAPLRAEMRVQTPRILSNLTWARQGDKIISLYDNVIRS